MVDPELCINCGECVEICLQNCILSIGRELLNGYYYSKDT
ncbi:4Fe-4S binding protein [Enterococcus hulanensis]